MMRFISWQTILRPLTGDGWGNTCLYEWIEQAVQPTDAASIRHRRLPAEQVVWLMVALALYRHKSISEVLDDLGLALPDTQTPFVSKSAVAQARQRLGPEPLRGCSNTPHATGAIRIAVTICSKGCSCLRWMARRCALRYC